MHNKENLYIIGASGHGRVVADIAFKMKKWKQIVFLDDDEALESSMEIAIKGKVSDAYKYIEEHDIFIAIADYKTREKIQHQLEIAGASIPILIHPSAILGEKVEIGIGTVVMAGVVINCCSKIGKSCIVNTSASIDHDCQIEDFVHIAPGAHLSGTIKVGKGTWIGVGAAVSNNVDIIGGCFFGAGSVVIKDIMEPGTYVGVPVRKII